MTTTQVIHSSAAGIFSISKEDRQKKFRLNFQGAENSAEIFIKLVADKKEANAKIDDMLKIK